MDDAIWLRNIFDDRFRALATGTLYFYHANEHLHALGGRLSRNKDDARKWSSTLLKDLRENREPALLRTLDELAVQSDEYPADTAESIRQTETYFKKHSEHMAYAEAEAQGRPIGSGSIESQCSQFQNRFKRRGQFWSLKGFAAVLEISVRHQNNELRSLWAA